MGHRGSETSSQSQERLSESLEPPVLSWFCCHRGSVEEAGDVMVRTRGGGTLSSSSSSDEEHHNNEDDRCKDVKMQTNKLTGSSG